MLTNIFTNAHSRIFFKNPTNSQGILMNPKMVRSPTSRDQKVVSPHE